MSASHDDLVAQFSAVTGANASTASVALQNTEWNLQEAVSLFYAAHEGAPLDDDDDDDDGDADADDVPSVPATAPAHPRNPPSSSSSRASAQQPPSDTIPPARRPPGTRPKQMTLDELKKMHGEGDDDDDDDDKPQDLFAGGEKSALAVQNPDAAPAGPADHFRNILARARDRTPAAGEGAAGAGGAGGEGAQPGTRRTAFTGRAQTLGGDEAPSRVIDDPSAPPLSSNSRGQLPQQPQTRVNRTLHLWADGVSIDDGPLFRFDDPANADMMAQINQGRAPMSLLHVQPGEEVDLNLQPHKDENYHPLPKVWKPFEGQGQRLGSPTPGVASTSSTTPAAPLTPTARPAGTQAAADVPLDESQPTLRLQIRLTDGTRLAARFNTTHTVQDVYAFVERARASNSGAGAREWVLMTTFPSKELVDKTAVLGQMEELGRGGGVVVQKWR